MQYSAACDYLFSFLNYERIPFEYGRALNLKRMNAALDWAHHPERSYPSVLVAGTKGKGSTANFLSSIFSSHGCRTGLYTSPHLMEPCERIRINSKPVSKKEFAGAVTEVSRILRRHRGGKTLYGTLTFFEAFTLAAMLCFAKRKVDIAVFEVGMGGRLDATNVLHPLISVITPVSFDHEEHLGRTLSKIAAEKAAIIKKKGRLILSRQEPEARNIILRFARKAGAQVFRFGQEFKVSNVKYSEKGSRFDFQMNKMKLSNLTIQLPGEVQVQNAACAVATSVILSRYENTAQNLCIDPSAFDLRMTSVKKGLRDAFWPGRFEVIRRGGRIWVLDGAHNGASIEALLSSIRKLFGRRPTTVILGVSREKNLEAILKPLLKEVSCLIITRSGNPRALEPKVIIEALSRLRFSRPNVPAPNLKDAVHLAEKIAPKNSVMIITGSLFLVGEARKEFGCRRQF